MALSQSVCVARSVSPIVNLVNEHRRPEPAPTVAENPASARSTRRQRSIRGGAAVAPAISLARAASKLQPDPSRSVDRLVAPELGEKPTRGESDLARQDSGLDVPDNRTSTGSVASPHHGGIASRSVPPPERDRFLASVGALRDWIKDIGRDATWRIAIASMFWCVSTQLPLPNDSALARALSYVSAVTIGALVGRRLDRRKRRNRDAR